MITTGEGGMIVFKDKKMADKAKLLRDHGMTASKRYWHLFAGYNFRMTNMQAAVGVAQLSRIEEFNDKRTKLFHAYNEVLNSSRDLSLLPVNDWSINSRWLYTILLSGFGESFRNNLIEGLARDMISSRPGFYPLHIMPPYKDTKGNYKNSSYYGSNRMSILDFNNQTGFFSNEISIAMPAGPYGLEFSPSGRFLYVSFNNGSFIYQYDMCAPNIAGSRITIATNAGLFTGSFQRGPDGRIYIAQNNSLFLHRINNPDTQGISCNLQFNAVPLINVSRFGLPQFCYPPGLNVSVSPIYHN
jgi:hypothetical protein